MTALETVEEMLGALEEGNIAEAARRLADDFIVTGLIPEAMNRNEFLGVMKGLFAAMPDLAFHVSDVAAERDDVSLKTHLRGTHTELLSLPAIGIPPLAATGAEIVLPEETVEFTVRDGLISAARFIPAPGGGLPELLRQLGVELSIK